MRFSVTVVPCTVMLCILLSYLTPTTHTKEIGYHGCLYECSNCVIYWGETLYDGKKCATCCQYSNGVKADPECKVWVKNGGSRRIYSKKDQDYVNDILQARRWSKRWSNLNYGSIFGQEDIPSYCF